MTYSTLLVDIDDRGVAYVRLNRPDKRNALSADLISDLTTVAQTLGRDSQTRVVVLSGEGKVFCAGGDLEWMKAQIDADTPTRMKEARRLANMLRVLKDMPKPLIGRIHGGAYGGGVGLACVCDVAMAESGTRFGLTETRLGLIPATIAPYVLARLGEGTARRLFMSSRIFDAEAARRFGIVAEVTGPEAFDEVVEAEVAPYLNAAPGAIAFAKAQVQSLGRPIDDATIDACIRSLADVWEGEEAKHGIEAFLNKSKPRWSNSG